MENINIPISFNVVKSIIKNTHIFNDIILASKPRVIKVSPKLDMVIIYVDIWNVQSSTEAKCLMNKCFNIGNFIVTIQDANMSSGISQCKNY